MILTKAERDDYAPIGKLYKTSFPRDERAPYFLIKRRASQGRGDMLVAREEGEIVGFAYIIPYQDLAYLFYLAVAPEKQGGGRGSEILHLLKQRYAGCRLFLAREVLDKKADNYEQRKKRREFYLKNGFHDMFAHIKEASVVYDAMGIGNKVSSQEYDDLITRWGGTLLRRFVDLRLFYPNEA